MDSLGVCDNAIGGHWDCGAISAIATRTCLDHMAAVANWLQYTGSSGVINAARTHALAADRLHALTPSECRGAVRKHQDRPCIALALPQRRFSLHARRYGIWSGDIDALNSCGNRIAYRACPGLCQNPPFEGIRKPGQTVYFNFEGNRHVAV
ncbi:hypothetical protein [Caballeronia sp. dw_19]|uniref:hypothetical protein n=1 Tax=Caballeronia sp. dw_19 TaxID=2719791 RepID=UPI0021083180|nr:hypothetical protein [Caballeronia sp. dw_19]